MMGDERDRVTAIERDVFGRTIGDQAEIGLRARIAYGASHQEVWSALTEPDRLRRWFPPVSGELRQGGAFQSEGNAGGTIRRCEPPRLLVVTWGDEASVVSLRLSPATGGATTVELEHTVPRDVTGNGAGVLFVGPGWDTALVGLDAYLKGQAPANPVAAATSRESQALARAATLAWAAAVERSGTATAEEVAAAQAAALSQWAPDL